LGRWIRLPANLFVRYSSESENPLSGNRLSESEPHQEKETGKMKTHWLVVDQDGTVLAWFPKSEDRAKERAAALVADTSHELVEGSWNPAGTGWVLA